MGQLTNIQWCHHTFNLWWGCQHVSPGCNNCYAEADAKRYGYNVWGPDAEYRTFGEKHWNEPRKWNAAAAAAGERRRVFCASMMDFADKRGPKSELAKLWPLIEETEWLDWLLLTKRIDRVMGIVPWHWIDGFPRNVWLGTTIEDQRRADERLPELLAFRHLVRVLFASCEPLLERIELTRGLAGRWCSCSGDLIRPNPLFVGVECSRCFLRFDRAPKLDWVIVGGESGGHARKFDISWARSIRDQCSAAGAAFFMKQLGARPDIEEYARVDYGTEFFKKHGNKRLKLVDRKGGDPQEWPEDLQARAFPELRP